MDAQLAVDAIIGVHINSAPDLKLLMQCIDSIVDANARFRELCIGLSCKEEMYDRVKMLIHLKFARKGVPDTQWRLSMHRGGQSQFANIKRCTNLMKTSGRPAPDFVVTSDGDDIWSSTRASFMTESSCRRRAPRMGIRLLCLVECDSARPNLGRFVIEV